MIKALLALLSVAKLGKVLVTGGSMLLSVVVYAWVFGWPFALGLVGMLFVHEMGHFHAARQRGLAVGLPAFIPFVGAWVQLKDLPRDAETEAYVGMAGPLGGSLAALAVYFLGREQGASWMLAVAYAGFFINLINLIPILPFDGGRITAVLSPRIWLLGVPLLLLLFLYRPSPLLILIALIAVPQVIRAWQHDPHTPESQAYYGNISHETRFSYATLYIGLAAFLAIMCEQLHEELPRATF